MQQGKQEISLEDNESFKAFKSCELVIVCLLVSLIGIIIGVIEHYLL